jgi:hypothetical protein
VSPNKRNPFAWGRDGLRVDGVGFEKGRELIKSDDCCTNVTIDTIRAFCCCNHSDPNRISPQMEEGVE